MTGFFDRMLGRTPPKTSSAIAKERLQFVLLHDRISLPPERLEEMKQEILAVISKYVSVDDKNVDIALQQRDRSSMLVAAIPFSKAYEGPEDDDPNTPSALMLLEDDESDETVRIDSEAPQAPETTEDKTTSSDADDDQTQ